MLKLKQETMQCNIIAQRMALQEHLIQRAEAIIKRIDEQLSNEEEIKKLERPQVEEEIVRDWLMGFEINNPSDFFEENETDDLNLETAIQSELEFMISTLELFGLPKDYMNGGGHHADWNTKKQESKGGKKKAAAKKKKGAKMSKL